MKLGDLGFATECETVLTQPCGTPHYVAPEILKMEAYGLGVDIWSVGVITFLLLSGDLPFEEGFEIETGSGAGLLQMYEDIKTGNYSMNEDDWSHISKDARQLTTQLLQVDPTKRLTASKALQSPWFSVDRMSLRRNSLHSSQERICCLMRKNGLGVRPRTSSKVTSASGRHWGSVRGVVLSGVFDSGRRRASMAASASATGRRRASMAATTGATRSAAIRRNLRSAPSVRSFVNARNTNENERDDHTTRQKKLALSAENAVDAENEQNGHADHACDCEPGVKDGVSSDMESQVHDIAEDHADHHEVHMHALHDTCVLVEKCPHGYPQFRCSVWNKPQVGGH